MTDQTPDIKPQRGLIQRARGLVRDIHGRSLLVRFAIAVVLVALFIVIPAFIASRPAFTQRYPAFQTLHDSWQKSVHAEVSCYSCHVGPDGVSRAVHSLRMASEFYLQLLPTSREPALFERPSNEACSSCHIDLRTVSPSGDLSIPHTAHVKVLKMDCVQCHDYLVHELNPQGNNSPTMEGCLECHDGVKAKSDCDACHNEKAAPKSHEATSWPIVHSQKQKTEDCESCHGWTERWCADCHARRPRSHTVDWRKTHRTTVETRRNCEACHEGAFCERCHGEVPQLNFDPALKLAE